MVDGQWAMCEYVISDAIVLWILCNRWMLLYDIMDVQSIYVYLCHLFVLTKCETILVSHQPNPLKSAILFY